MGDGDCFAVGAGGFGSDVDDGGALGDHFLGDLEGFGDVEGAVSGEGIVVDVDDAHDADFFHGAIRVLGWRGVGPFLRRLRFVGGSVGGGGG